MMDMLEAKWFLNKIDNIVFLYRKGGWLFDIWIAVTGFVILPFGIIFSTFLFTIPISGNDFRIKNDWPFLLSATVMIGFSIFFFLACISIWKQGWIFLKHVIIDIKNENTEFRYLFRLTKTIKEKPSHILLRYHSGMEGPDDASASVIFSASKKSIIIFRVEGIKKQTFIEGYKLAKPFSEALNIPIKEYNGLTN